MNKVPPTPYDPICIQSLEYILENGSATATEMREYASWAPLTERMRKLSDDGLVDYYLPDKGRRTVHYILTEKGRVFTQMVKLSHELYYGRLNVEDADILEKVEELLKLSVEEPSTE